MADLRDGPAADKHDDLTRQRARSRWRRAVISTLKATDPDERADRLVELEAAAHAVIDAEGAQ